MAKWLDPGRLARLRQKQETSFTPIFLHRPLAILLLIPIADVKWITPNRLTTLNVLMRFVVAYLIWPERWGGIEQTPLTLWVAVVLWHLGAVLDAADGTLARYRGSGSLFGRYYDKVSDRLVTLALVLALAARTFDRTGEVVYVFLAMIYVATMSASSVAKWIDLGLRAELGAQKKAEDPGEVAAPTRTFGAWVKYLIVSLRYAVVITEMDLPLWGSIALVIGREEWLLLYLGIFAGPYATLATIRRGWLLHRAEQRKSVELVPAPREGADGREGVGASAR